MPSLQTYSEVSGSLLNTTLEQSSLGRLYPEFSISWSLAVIGIFIQRPKEFGDWLDPFVSRLGGRASENLKNLPHVTKIVGAGPGLGLDLRTWAFLCLYFKYMVFGCT